jgi:hypothetical protein
VIEVGEPTGESAERHGVNDYVLRSVLRSMYRALEFFYGTISEALAAPVVSLICQAMQP